MWGFALHMDSQLQNYWNSPGGVRTGPRFWVMLLISRASGNRTSCGPSPNLICSTKLFTITSLNWTAHDLVNPDRKVFSDYVLCLDPSASNLGLGYLGADLGVRSAIFEKINIPLLLDRGRFGCLLVPFWYKVPFQIVCSIQGNPGSEFGMFI